MEYLIFNIINDKSVNVTRVVLLLVALVAYDKATNENFLHCMCGISKIGQFGL